MKRYIRIILSSKITFFLVFTILILGLNLTPLIMDIRHAPSGRNFPLIHNNVQDYFFYQALMNEGANNAILTSDPYTAEPHQPSIIFSYFLWLGKLSKLLGIPNAITYHLVRIILGILFLLFTFYFLLYIRIPYPRLTYFFFLFAAPFMHTINDYGKIVSVPYMSWWNGIDPIRRAAFLPHHMLGGLLLILSVMLLFKFIKTPARAALARLILISAIMAFVHTPSLFIILLIIPPSFLIYYLINISHGKNSKFKIQNSKFIGLFAYWFIGLFFLSVMILQTKSGFPWSQYIDWEKNLQFPLDRELIGALGILFSFSLLGIYYAIRSKRFEYIFIACWLVVPFLFIPFASKLNLSNIRLIQGVPFLPLSILAILGIKTILNYFGNKQPKISILKTVLNAKYFRFFLGKDTQWQEKGNLMKLGVSEKFGIEAAIVGLVTIIFIIFTYPTLTWSLKDQIREYWPIYGNVYLDNRLKTAFDFINLNYPQKTITLATFYAGNYLPAYTHTVSFIGHFGYTYKLDTKQQNVDRFFRNEMLPEEAKNFLMGNKIALVFQGPEEKPLVKNYLYPTLLKIVYDKEEVTLYRPI